MKDNYDKFVDKVIKKRYFPGQRNIKNKLDLDKINFDEIKELFKIDFDIYLSSIGNALLNVIYSKKYDSILDKLMEEKGVDQKIVVGRDCNMLSGYMVGCSRECFDIFKYYELKKNPKLIDYVIDKKLLDSKRDFKKLKEEIHNNFDLNDTTVICDTGFSDVKLTTLAKYLGFKEPILVLGEGNFVTKEFETINLGIRCSYLESSYHPIEPYKEINKVVKKEDLSEKEKEDIYLYCLATEEFMKNKNFDKALDKIFYKYTKKLGEEK